MEIFLSVHVMISENALTVSACFISIFTSSSDSKDSSLFLILLPSASSTVKSITSSRYSSRFFEGFGDFFFVNLPGLLDEVSFEALRVK